MTGSLHTLVLASASAPRLAVDLLILLAAAATVAMVLRKFRLESIPGYLIAGVLVGPRALGLIGADNAVAEVSELAIILLMFGIGLHLDVSTMRRGIVHILLVGVLTTLAFIVLGWGALVAGGVPSPAALTLALAAAVSSTAILVRLLVARREVRAPHGRVTLGVSIVQDLMSVAVMAALPAIAGWAGVVPSGVFGGVAVDAPGWAAPLMRAGVGLGGVAVLLVAGRLFLPRLLQEVARVGSGELVLVVSAVLALGAAITTSLLGFSPEMGAFLAGFLLASTPFRYQLSGQLAPMRDILMAVFFTTVGLNVDPRLLATDWWIILVSVVGVIGAKWVILGVASWAAGMTASSASLTGAYLANAGEFTLVILAAAGAAGILSDHQQGDAIAVVIATLIASPLLLRPAHALAERLGGVPLASWVKSSALRERASAAETPGVPDGQETTAPQDAGAVDGAAGGEAGAGPPVPRLRHVIIAGFGPVGRTLADRFAVLGVPFTVIELNAATVQRQAVLGRPVVYGDVTNPEVLESAGVGHADAVLLTIPDDEATLRACRAIRALAPDVFIAVRTNFLSGKFVAHQLGADLVTVEEVATAQAMEREVLAALPAWLKTPAAYRTGVAEERH